MLNFTKYLYSFSVAVMLSGVCMAQQPYTPTAQENLDQQKSAGQLTGQEMLLNQHPSSAKITLPTPNTQGELCNCWINRDTTWSVVPFDCAGGSGGPGIAPEYRNDD